MDRQYVGIDFHRRRSVIVRLSADGERLGLHRIVNDPFKLAEVLALCGEAPEVVIEATYGWYWAVDLLRDLGAVVHLANPRALNWGDRRVKNDVNDATDLADMLRLNRLAEAWIAPPALREVVSALQTLRGVAALTATTVAVEVGSFARFATARQIMAYAGIVPSEHSTGGPGHSRRGHITKTGNAHVRRIMIESSWTYRHRPKVGPRLRQRQKEQPEAIKEIDAALAKGPRRGPKTEGGSEALVEDEAA